MLGAQENCAEKKWEGNGNYLGTGPTWCKNFVLVLAGRAGGESCHSTVIIIDSWQNPTNHKSGWFKSGQSQTSNRSLVTWFWFQLSHERPPLLPVTELRPNVEKQRDPASFVNHLKHDRIFVTTPAFCDGYEDGQLTWLWQINRSSTSVLKP